MSRIPDDLVKVIATYTTLDQTIMLITLGLDLARAAYLRRGLLWREKSQVETSGVMLNGSAVEDWLLYYQIVRTHYYGTIVNPYSRPGLITATPNVITIIENHTGLAYVTTDGYLRWSNSDIMVPLRGSVRSLSKVGDDVYLLMDRGDVLVVYPGAVVEGKAKISTIELNGFVVEMRIGRDFIRYLTRDQEMCIADSTGRDTARRYSGAIHLTSMGSAMLEKCQFHSYLDEWGCVHSVNRDGIDSTPIPNTNFVRYTYLGFGITINGKFVAPLGPQTPRIYTKIATTSHVPGGVTRYELVTSDRRVEIYVEGFEDLLTMPGLDQYTGRIECRSTNYILVAE